MKQPSSYVRPSVALSVATLAVLGAQLALANPAAAAGRTIFVDKGNPSCSPSGGGTPAVPFCTISQAANVAAAGDTVLVSTGTYSEQVSPKFSGTPGLPITFAAAPGAAVRVTSPAGSAFKISSRSWINVSGFTVWNTSNHGIYVSSSSHITIANNDVSDAGERVDGYIKKGIYLTSVSDSVVSGNVSHDNSEAGIYLDGATVRVTVSDNELFENARGFIRAAPGIDVRGQDNVIVRNISHDNEDTGLQFYNGAARNLVAANVAYRNGDHGIDDLGAVDQVITGNTVYSNVTAGINVEGGSTGATVTNNISVDNGVNSPRTKSDIRVDAASITGAVVDWNLVSVPPSYVLYVWGSQSYTSLSAFQAGTGQEQHGIQADPMWVDRGEGDFHLLPGSPAIDSAWSDAPGEQTVDVAGNPRVDDPDVADTGSGTRTYDDRGAYERQP